MASFGVVVGSVANSHTDVSPASSYSATVLHNIQGCWSWGGRSGKITIGSNTYAVGFHCRPHHKLWPDGTTISYTGCDKCKTAGWANPLTSRPGDNKPWAYDGGHICVYFKGGSGGTSGCVAAQKQAAESDPSLKNGTVDDAKKDGWAAGKTFFIYDLGLPTCGGSGFGGSDGDGEDGGEWTVVSAAPPEIVFDAYCNMPLILENAEEFENEFGLECSYERVSFLYCPKGFTFQGKKDKELIGNCALAIRTIEDRLHTVYKPWAENVVAGTGGGIPKNVSNDKDRHGTVLFNTERQDAVASIIAGVNPDTRYIGNKSMGNGWAMSLNTALSMGFTPREANKHNNPTGPIKIALFNDYIPDWGVIADQQDLDLDLRSDMIYSRNFLRVMIESACSKRLAAVYAEETENPMMYYLTWDTGELVEVDATLLKRTFKWVKSGNSANFNDDNHLGVFIEVGSFRNRSSNLESHVERVKKIGLDYGVTLRCSASNITTALQEMKEFSYTIRRLAPMYGVWIQTSLTNNESMNDEIMDIYYKELVKLGVVDKVGIICGSGTLDKMSWGDHCDRWYWWNSNTADGYMSIKRPMAKLITPALFARDPQDDKWTPIKCDIECRPKREWIDMYESKEGNVIYDEWDGDTYWRCEHCDRVIDHTTIRGWIKEYKALMEPAPPLGTGMGFTRDEAIDYIEEVTAWTWERAGYGMYPVYNSREDAIFRSLSSDIVMFNYTSNLGAMFIGGRYHNPFGGMAGGYIGGGDSGAPGGYSNVLSALRSVSNDLNGAMNAAEYFCRLYERPANVDSAVATRRNTASNFWNNNSAMNSNEQQVVAYLQSRGLNKAAAIGVAANIRHEGAIHSRGDKGHFPGGSYVSCSKSGHTANSCSTGVWTSFGMCQWHNTHGGPRADNDGNDQTGRGRNMMNFCAANGGLWSGNFMGQVKFMCYEMGL